MSDFEKMLSILNNQQEPERLYDWKPIVYTIRRYDDRTSLCDHEPEGCCENCDKKDALEINIQEDQITFHFDKKTKRLKFICNYK